MTLPDISEWFAAEGRALREEAVWVLEQRYRRDADFAAERLKRHGLHDVLELGCGSGLFAARLKKLLPGLLYTGVDRCDDFLEMARSRAPGLEFLNADLRSVRPARAPFDCVCCWQVLKHFGLHEWDAVVGHVLSLGRFAAFSVQTLPRVDLDNGSDFHHTFVTSVHLGLALEAAGHEVLDRVRTNAWELEGYGEAEDWNLWTRQVGP